MRPVNTEMRKKIARLLRQGKSQVEVCKIVGRAPATITHYVKALGMPVKEYKTAYPLKHGKRRCATCGKNKTPGAFPGERNADCTMCLRARRSK